MGLEDTTRTIKESFKKPKDGWFALESVGSNSIAWQHCRDQFASSFTDRIDGFYFSHSVPRCNIVAFVGKTEAILDVPESTFQATNREYATWVTPSVFWKSVFIRRSLFTLLLRAGMLYDPVVDNYELALYGNEYLHTSKAAVMRFLFGFTEFCESPYWKLGWAATFSGKPIDDIRNKLVSPKKAEPSLIGQGSIWR
jgi:hypothetical protein